MHVHPNIPVITTHLIVLIGVSDLFLYYTGVNVR